ncbi:MAG: hypothetical protein QXT67_04775 [Candidatus Bathyarchaeia archaeon]
MALEFESKLERSHQKLEIDRKFIDEKIEYAFKLINDAIEGLKYEIETDWIEPFRLSFWCGDAGMACGLMISAMEIAEKAGLKHLYIDKWKGFISLWEEFWKKRDEWVNKFKEKF